MSKSATIFWSCILFGALGGFGWIIWWAAGGYSLFYRILWVLGMYAVLTIACYACSFPGAGCIPVKFNRRD